jgi:histidyl-tRNA synthetase
MESAGVPPTLEDSALVAIDKLDKVGMEGVRKELGERGIAPAAAAALLETMEAAPTGNDAMLSWLDHLLVESELGSRGVGQLRAILELTAHGPAAAYVRIDPYIARGLSYYTGPIFEIEFPGFSGSGGGGGRYDDLVGMFSGQSVPACGFSLGLERILLLMEEQNMFPDRLAGQPQALVTQFDESTVGASLELAQRLRAGGFRIDLYPDVDRYGRQFKYADERRIRFALLISPRELQADVVAIKDLGSGEQVDVPAARIHEELAARLAEMQG